MPAIGDVVTCRVLSVNPRFAKMQIVCVRDTVLQDPFRCQLRKEDVRAHDKDRVEMYKCFRPSDIVLAKVLSYGEANTGKVILFNVRLPQIFRETPFFLRRLLDHHGRKRVGCGDRQVGTVRGQDDPGLLDRDAVPQDLQQGI